MIRKIPFGPTYEEMLHPETIEARICGSKALKALGGK